MRCADMPHLPKQQRNQHSANAAIAILEGVQCFKFNMGNSRFNERMVIAVVIDISKKGV